MSIRPQPDIQGKTGLLASSLVSLLPSDFVWMEEEYKKMATLSNQLNCTPEVAHRIVVFLLAFVGSYQGEIAVAAIPGLLAQFPVKWGYRKKRHDFLKLMQDLDFIRVQINYYAKIRAKTYTLAPSGSALLGRVLATVFRGNLSPKPKAAEPADSTDE